MMTELFSSNTLVSKMAKKNKVLTVEVTLETSAEFQVAAAILGAKSYATILHQHIVAKIREAKGLVSKEEFDQLVIEKISQIHSRSKVKAQEHKNTFEKINKDEFLTVPADEIKKKKGGTSKQKK